jgi:hypothetical protein
VPPVGKTAGQAAQGRRAVERRHRELHRRGDEAAWRSNAGIDPTVTARALWLETHPLPGFQGISASLTRSLERTFVATRITPSVGQKAQRDLQNEADDRSWVSQRQAALIGRRSAYTALPRAALLLEAAAMGLINVGQLFIFICGGDGKHLQ